MNRISRVILSFLVVCLMAPSFVNAGPIIRGGEMVSVDASQILEGDFYGFGSVVTLSGEAEYDVYAAGGTVTVNAPVAADLTVVGGVVHIHSDIGDDLRVLGGEVTVAGKVAGDVAVTSGILTILSTAEIQGDILFLGGSLVVEGDVVGAIHAYTETARINATVGGDITVTAPAGLTLSDQTRVKGSVMYTSTREVSRAQNAVVEGSINRTTIEVPTTDLVGYAKGVFMFALTLLFMAGSLFALARSKVEWFVREAYARPGQHGLVGLATFLVVPFVSVILFVSVVGLPLGLLALSLYGSLLLLAFALNSIFIGYALQRLIFKQDVLGIQALLIGVAAAMLLTAIPVIGFFTLFALFLIGMGTIGTLSVRLLRE